MSAKIEHELEKVSRELALLKAEYQECVDIVSHDLEAPLRQIKGFSEIIVSKHGNCFDEKSKRHFELIQNGSSQVTQMLDAVKNYSRLNTRAKPFTLLDCNNSVAKALDNLSALVVGSGAIINYESLPKIIADENQMTILFQQLIKNSLIYQTAGNKPVVSISFTQDIDFWQFQIVDNGIGVPENLSNKIFKILRRGVSNKKYPGLGMGLALARKILQKHYGDINVTQSSNKGTTFSFKIAKDLPYE